MIWFFFHILHLKIKIYKSFPRDSEKDYKTEHSSEEKKYVLYELTKR